MWGGPAEITNCVSTKGLVRFEAFVFEFVFFFGRIGEGKFEQSVSLGMVVCRLFCPKYANLSFC